MTNLICGSRPTETLIVHQLGYTGILATHRTASLLGPQFNGSESGILSIKHQQCLGTGSCRGKSRKAKSICVETPTFRFGRKQFSIPLVDVQVSSAEQNESACGKSNGLDRRRWSSNILLVSVSAWAQCSPNSFIKNLKLCPSDNRTQRMQTQSFCFEVISLDKHKIPLWL